MYNNSEWENAKVLQPPEVIQIVEMLTPVMVNKYS